MKNEKTNGVPKGAAQRTKSATTRPTTSTRKTTTATTNHSRTTKTAKSTTTKTAATTTTTTATTTMTTTTTTLTTSETDMAGSGRSESTTSSLERTEDLLHSLSKAAVMSALRKEEELEWQEYLSCRTLPNGKCIRELNTYLALWRESNELDTQATLNKAEEALDILALLERAIDEESNVTLADQRMLIFGDMKDLLRAKLDHMTYVMLRDVAANTDIETGEFRQLISSKRIGLGLWSISAPAAAAAAAAASAAGGGGGGQARMATGGSLGADFASLGCSFELPTTIMATETTAVRVLKASYDHFSKTCVSNKLRKRNDDTNFNLDSCMTNILHDPQRLDPVLGKQMFKEEVRNRYNVFRLGGLHPNELNLRRYVVLGGVYYFDLLQVPPQPKRVAKWTLCQIEPEQKLKVRAWEASYRVARGVDDASSAVVASKSKKTPEELEQELKQQELELQKLIRIKLKLSDSCLWFEPPTLVRWDESLGHWSTDGFVDVKFNESVQQMTFRSLKMGIFALAAFRFPNLPLQSWEIWPGQVSSTSPTVNVMLAAASVQADFVVGKGYVELSNVQNGSKCPSMEALKHTKWSLEQLVVRLRHLGLDLFPEADSHCYIEGLPLKDLFIEHHLYRCMALVNQQWAFAWSRWNLLAGPDKLVMQFRAHSQEDNDVQHQIVLTTPNNTSILECTEASQTFSTETIGHEAIFDDLYHLSNTKGHNKEQPEAELVDSLFNFLKATRLLSYA